jgi:thiamine-phosphate pyrophosphorylase
VSLAPPGPLLVITDRKSAALSDLEQTATAAFRGGCRWIMVREKDLDTLALISLAARVVAAAQPTGARVLINGDVDAALAVDAHGAHLPQSLSVGHSVADSVAAARDKLTAIRMIGVSAHSPAEARAAEEAGADYITLSPIFETASKPGYGPALGTDALRAVAAAAAIPVLALGGVSPANAGACMAAGAAGIAVMGSVMGAQSPEAEVRDLLTALAG